MKAITTSTDPPRDARVTASSSDDVLQGAIKREVNPRRLRAIVADDDEPTLHMVAAAVEKFGAEVTCASTGAELIEQLGSDPPFDLIVTDVSMPWMTGLQVMHAVRTAGLRTPVVVMTAHRDTSIVAQACSLGDAAVLVHKPFGVADLHAAIRLALGESGVEPIGANREPRRA